MVPPAQAQHTGGTQAVPKEVWNADPAGCWGLQVAWKAQEAETEPHPAPSPPPPSVRRPGICVGQGVPEAELRTDGAHPSSWLHT